MKIKLLLFAILALFCNSVNSQSTASPQVHSFEIEAPELDTIKKIWVYLPQSYKDAKKSYPVIYMHDAQNLFDKETAYAGEWGVDESLDSIQKPETIIVGIEHGGKKRIDELTPFPNEKYGGGMGKSYLNFLITRLKPHIDSTYRTLPQKDHTGIFGSSLGGLISFFAAFEYPHVFGKAGVYSPSFWFSEEIYTFAEEKDLPEDTKFFFLVGGNESEEMVPDLERMLELLKKKGLKERNFKYLLVPEGKHNEATWRTSFPESYKWLME